MPNWFSKIGILVDGWVGFFTIVIASEDFNPNPHWGGHVASENFNPNPHWGGHVWITLF
jgi:hypothetical protein